MLFRSRPRPCDPAPDGQPGDPAEPDDAVLVAAARADPRAFARLYERFLGPVYRYCHVRLGTREAAEDATSEVFLKTLTGLPGYRDGAFAAWLFRIAHNVVVDCHRRCRPAERIEAADDPPDTSPTPEEAALARAEREALRAAVATLTEEQRLAVELQVAGRSGQEIADVLGKSVAAAKQLRFRAVSRLRMILRPDRRSGALGGPR
ncbi:MAG TPA: sigma-70 family RNA polymerase sigma factor [Chloroflexota bacterium]|nr:sigma-70 family RNA polymerase sigma factor [Chloroflexota bacterium]